MDGWLSSEMNSDDLKRSGAGRAWWFGVDTCWWIYDGGRAGDSQAENIEHPQHKVVITKIILDDENPVTQNSIRKVNGE